MVLAAMNPATALALESSLVRPSSTKGTKSMLHPPFTPRHAVYMNYMKPTLPSTSKHLILPVDFQLTLTLDLQSCCYSRYQLFGL